MQLTNRDRKLISALQSDCRLSNAALAERVGMSASACWRRVKSLEEAGIIVRYGAVIRMDRIGFGFRAIVHVQLTRHDGEAMEHFIESVARREEIQACYATTGQADYHLHVVCRDIESYNQFLEQFLFRLPAVRSAQTNVVLKEVKSSAM